MKKLLILIFIGTTLYFGYKWRLNQEFSDENLAKQIPIQNKKMGLPMVMGPLTMDSISAQPGQKLFVKVIFTLAPTSAINVDKLLESKGVLVNALCKDQWVLLALKHGVTATYEFFGNDDTLATQIMVTKADCGA